MRPGTVEAIMYDLTYWLLVQVPQRRETPLRHDAPQVSHFCLFHIVVAALP